MKFWSIFDHFEGLGLEELSMNDIFVDVRYLTFSSSVTCWAGYNTNLSLNRSISKAVR